MSIEKEFLAEESLQDDSLVYNSFPIEDLDISLSLESESRLYFIHYVLCCKYRENEMKWKLFNHQNTRILRLLGKLDY